MNGSSVICRSQTGRIIAGVTQELRTLLRVVATSCLATVPCRYGECPAEFQRSAGRFAIKYFWSDIVSGNQFLIGPADKILDRKKGRDYVHKGEKGKGNCNV